MSTAVSPLRRFDEFEAYRGFAAVAVVVFHGYQQTGQPYSGAWHTLLHNLDTLVDLFFVLSAFLLTTAWVRAGVDRTRVQSARGYVVRRAIRILPVYWIAIVVVWASRNGSFPGDWRDLAEHLTFTQVFDAKRIFYTIGPAWSLAVEVMFYGFLLVAGLALYKLCGTTASRRLRVAYWLLVPAVMAAGGCCWIWWEQSVRHVAPEHWPTWFGPLAKAPVFAVGVLLAVLVQARPQGIALPPPGPLLLRVGGLALVVWSWAARGTTGQGPYEQWVHPLSAVGFGLVLAASAVAPLGGRWERTLALRPLLILGTISYSVYLWHEPILRLLDDHGVLFRNGSAGFLEGTALLLALSLVGGWASYWVIEYPVAQLRHAIDKDGRLTVESYVDDPHPGGRVSRAPDGAVA